MSYAVRLAGVQGLTPAERVHVLVTAMATTVINSLERSTRVPPVAGVLFAKAGFLLT